MVVSWLPKLQYINKNDTMKTLGEVTNEKLFWVSPITSNYLPKVSSSEKSSPIRVDSVGVS